MTKKIKIYTTPTCPYCNMVKDYFKENNIEFEEIDVSKKPEAAKEVLEKSGQMSVPVIDIDGEIVVGFNKKKFKELLNI